jgi:hypothetical protein
MFTDDKDANRSWHLSRVNMSDLVLANRAADWRRLKSPGSIALGENLT